jgi:aspartyl-tRNA(Asn)/glutamyl-tRNA(Gln) amidotransferase subunit A
MTELHDLGFAEAAALIRQRKVSPIELTDALLARIERVEPTLRAFVTVDADGARKAARAAEVALGGSGDLGPLHGVPFGAKDIYNTAGVRTTAGFSPLAENVPASDAFTVARLKAAGAVLIGKTVTTQFASADPPPTHNPWRLDRTPGGSSSGSGAGVAAQLVPMALGTQTGGSILRPAAYNGVVGLKPTYGRVSRGGIYPLALTLDHAGPIARSVEDVALALQVLAGHDPSDPRSLDAEVPDYQATLAGQIEAPRLGVLGAFLERSEPDVRAHVEAVIERLGAAGATIRQVTLPSPIDLYYAAHAITMQAESGAVHADWIVRDRASYAPKIRASAMVGQLIPAWAYQRAQRLRRRLAAETAEAFGDFDGFILPTASNVAPGPETTGDPSFQSPWSLLGLPSISLPSGLNVDGLPFAVQIVSRRLAEPTLLRAARWVERELAFDARPPEIG